MDIQDNSSLYLVMHCATVELGPPAIRGLGGCIIDINSRALAGLIVKEVGPWKMSVLILRKLVGLGF